MPYQTIPNSQVRYALMGFDSKGNERTDDPEAINGKFSNRILADVKATAPTDVFFFSHGWQGDLPSAIDQYNRWIGAMNKLDADKQAMGVDFRPIWIGLHWPSLAWGQEKFGADASFGLLPITADQARKQITEQFGDNSEVKQQLDIIFHEQEVNAAAFILPDHVKDAYNRLATLIGYTGGGPGGAPDAEGVPFDPNRIFDAASQNDNFGGAGVGGALLAPLRTLTFWTMKNRARNIGEGGMHDLIAQLMNALPNSAFHLMGHSFGCAIVSSILGGKNGKSPLPRAIDSLALIQGALSLWAYADQIKDFPGKTGYFNSAFHHPAVRGPIMVTRSKNDAAVGVAYPAAVAVVLSDPNFAPESQLTPAFLPIYGGIGTFGIRSFSNIHDQLMLPAGGAYQFQSGHIYNLVGDQFIVGHTAIDGPEVAHAIWQAAIQARTVRPK
jgi:pimeloyl-ACP methyl ester carboxylesterase